MKWWQDHNQTANIQRSKARFDELKKREALQPNKETTEVEGAMGSQGSGGDTGQPDTGVTSSGSA